MYSGKNAFSLQIFVKTRQEKKDIESSPRNATGRIQNEIFCLVIAQLKTDLN